MRGAHYIIVGSLNKLAFTGHSSGPSSLGLGPQLTLVVLVRVSSEDNCLMERS